MNDIFVTPKPSGDGGPSLAIKRLFSPLRDLGYNFIFEYHKKYHGSFVNVGGGNYGPRILLKQKPFLYRPAGYYIKNIFTQARRPWSWRYNLSNLLIGLYLREAKWVVFQSEYARTVLSKKYGLPKHFSVIFNGVDLAQYHPMKQEKNRVPVIGSVGKLRHERVQDLIQVSESFRDEHKLFVAGPLNETERQMLLQHVKRRGIEIVLTGSVPSKEMVKVYNQLDILIHLAAADICPNVVVESLACGTPVICPSYGGTAELIGEGGIVIPGGPDRYPEEFYSQVASSIHQIFNDLDAYHNKARARAEESLDINKTAKKYAAALDQVVR